MRRRLHFLLAFPPNRCVWKVEPWVWLTRLTLIKDAQNLLPLLHLSKRQPTEMWAGWFQRRVSQFGKNKLKKKTHSHFLSLKLWVHMPPLGAHLNFLICILVRVRRKKKHDVNMSEWRLMWPKCETKSKQAETRNRGWTFLLGKRKIHILV